MAHDHTVHLSSEPSQRGFVHQQQQQQQQIVPYVEPATTDSVGMKQWNEIILGKQRIIRREQQVASLAVRVARDYWLYVCGLVLCGWSRARVCGLRTCAAGDIGWWTWSVQILACSESGSS